MKGGASDDGEANFHLVPIHSSKSISFLQLENIEEDAVVNFPSPKFFPEPETPEAPLEFLARSWSLTAIEASARPSQSQDGSLNRLETSPFHFAPSVTSQMVMDRIMEHSLFAPRRNSHSSGPLVLQGSGNLGLSPPLSPRQQQHQQQEPEEPQQQKGQTTANARAALRGRSVGRWFKDMKERKKELQRAHNAQVHAAVSMAGVAAAVAAVAAATVASSATEDANKTSTAVASAASLIAAQCVELAESMGADHDQVAGIVSSAVNVKTAGDIMTLTAAAATALRGAATLKARTLKETRSHATVTPYDKLAFTYSGDICSEDGEAESCYTQELLARGCEFLKRSKKGELHWRLVSVKLNAEGQVLLKVRSKHMGGALRKKRKGVVLDVDPDIPAWPGRCLLDTDEQQRRYFGLKTATGMLEFECKSDYEHRLWTQGIVHLLNLSKQQQLASTKQ